MLGWERLSVVSFLKLLGSVKGGVSDRVSDEQVAEQGLRDGAFGGDLELMLRKCDVEVWRTEGWILVKKG